jgi:hypothetical protein
VADGRIIELPGNNPGQSVIASLFHIFGGHEWGLLGVLILAFKIWMLVDCLKHETESGVRVAWLLVILLVPFGALVYLIVRKERRAARQSAGGS